MKLRTQLGGTGDRGRWLVPLFLLLGVLAPTASVLWFMNAAVNNQRDASRRKLAEAYRGQLTLLRDRADAYWTMRAAELDRETREGSAAQAFERVVKGGLADSVVCTGRDGGAAYPAMTTTIAFDPAVGRADWMAAQTLENWHDPLAAADSWAAIARGERDIAIAARAAQARVRCLVRSGDKAAAVRAIHEEFGGGRLLRATDLGGRVIAADELLLAIQLTGHSADAVRKLAQMVADYGVTMPAPQRLYLMEELRGSAEFPTAAAERLAAQFLAAGRAQAGEAALEPGGAPGQWKLTSPEGRAIGLYRTATVAAAMRGLGSGLKARLGITPPGSAAAPADDSIAAGPRLAGWQLSLTAEGGDGVDAVARRQTASYVWIAMLAIGVVAICGLATGQALRRQWRLARLKTDLTAAVSHELKTPLASMSLLVDTLLDDEAPDAKKTREYLELIASENARLSRLIENFLAFSRLERNRQRFDFRATRPESVVKSAVEASRERFAALEVRVEGGLPAVRADEDALVTVLLNLLDNAYKYTPGEKHIALRAYRQNKGVVFAVEDNGIGIAAGEQRRIFRRFYRVDQRLARETGGCGLGLSIVEFIVNAHGGSVRVQSEPGRGSTFSIVLPEGAA